MKQGDCPFCSFTTPIDDGGDLLGIHLFTVHQDKGLKVYIMGSGSRWVRCWCGHSFYDFDFAEHLAAHGGAVKHMLESYLLPRQGEFDLGSNPKLRTTKRDDP